MVNTAKPFVNCHTHIFNSACAPDYYFRMILPGWLDRFSDEIKAFLEKKRTKKFMTNLLKVVTLFDKEKRSSLERYLQFIEIGSSSSQRDVFLKLRENYINIPGTRIVALTLNMDHMANFKSNHPNISTQLTEIIELKKEFPNELFPFLSIDPRHLGGQELLDWVQKYFNEGNFFCGIKIYPAKGYFPFDPRLDNVYDWAAKNSIPVMTHCTRSGSFYIDTIQNSAVKPNPPSLNPDSPEMPVIYALIDKVLADTSIHKKNSIWCNLFTCPTHYLPVLQKYPNLKLCFAHFGGGNEVYTKDRPKYPSYFTQNWFKLIQDILANPDFPKVYTDISYTLASEKALNVIMDWYNANPNLQHKVLYGTDYYLAEQEGPEKNSLSQAWEIIGDNNMKKIAYDNPESYLSSKYYEGPK